MAQNQQLALLGQSVTVDSNGNPTFSGTPVPNSSFLRNRIINGNFEFWQRGTTSRTQGAAGTYSADRWTRMGYQDAAHERVSISSPPTGLYSRYAMRASSSTTGEVAGGTRIDLSQKIESVNCYDLAGQQVTVSFWVKFSAATISSSTATSYGNWFTYLQFNTSTTDSTASVDTGNSTTTAITLTNGSLPTTWTKYTATATVPSSTNNISVRFEFGGLGSTASAGTAWFDIAEVQLEVGTAATPFERRQYGQELALCQRYYNRDVLVAVGGGATPTVTNRTFYCSVNWPVAMRASPTMTLISTLASTNMNAGAWINLTASRGRFSVTNSVANDCALEAQYSAEIEL
jgi:hypothetical protein